MAKRSPILGYNHNFRHRGLVFHVQTEDSGVAHPHIFTHLFHGGVILTSRKLDYDASAAEEVVKALMQAQHRAVLKELKAGAFDVKIDQYLGGNPDLLPPEIDVAESIAAAEAADASRSSGRIDRMVAAAVDLAAVPEPVGPEDSSEVAQIHSPAPASAPEPPGLAQHSGGSYAQHRRASAPSIPRPAAGTVSGRPPATRVPASSPPRPAAPAPAARNRAGVVVSRPAVIVGAPPTVVAGRNRPRKAREESRPAEGLFGQDLISEKSLDEVILAYLSEDPAEE